jgi:ADP-ribosylglycohydrolase
MKEKVAGGIISVILGDALGVPVEFVSRATLRKTPVSEFLEFGTHNQPKGTWSDDSSLLLCTLESLLNGIDYKRTIDLFYDWYTKKYWTATGVLFDIGNTTREALVKYESGIEPICCGPSKEYSNGNGSLMRILPIAYEIYDKAINERRITTFNFSGLTHGHNRSKLACWLYVEIVRNILNRKEKTESVDEAYKTVENWCIKNELAEEWKYFFNCNSSVLQFEESCLSSTGYVIDTLESSIYSFLSNDTIIDSVLFSVNLGDDTDTVAAITGGLSGTFYGINNLNNKWIKQLKRIDEITELVEKYSMIKFG